MRSAIQKVDFIEFWIGDMVILYAL